MKRVVFFEYPTTPLSHAFACQFILHAVTSCNYLHIINRIKNHEKLYLTELAHPPASYK
jgi:hypothetical protein